MARYERILTGLRLDRPARRLGLELYPEGEGIRAEAGETMTQKEFQRAFALLRGYAARAALGGSGMIAAEQLPRQEGTDALFWVWFDRFQQEREPARRLAAAYNAFGALPGGFPRAGAAMERCLGRELARKLKDGLEALRREEGDLAEKAQPYERPAPWTREEWERLARGLEKAGREA